MRMDLGLTQTLKQIQTLSPQMYMSMEILCLNSLDLEDRIETEVENNVALELEESRKEEAVSGESGEAATTTDDRPAQESLEDPLSGDASFDRKVELWDRLARDEYEDRPRARSYDLERDDKLEALNNTEGRPISLAEHLEEQLNLLTAVDLKEVGVEEAEAEIIRALCDEVLYNLDERGYLLYPIEEIYRSMLVRLGGEAASTPELGSEVIPETAFSAPIQEPEGRGPDMFADQVSLPVVVESDAAVGSDDDVSPGPSLPPAAASETSGVTLEQMTKALSLVHRLDPPGIGGLDLGECLLLQLRRDKQSYPFEEKIIENHLDDLANNRLPKIAKALGATIDDIKVAGETIASLNPIPGKLFGGDAPQYIKPDVLVEEVDGRYEVRVLSDYLPRLRVSDYYRNLYKQSRKDPELKKFIKKKLDSAEWLLAAIRQRQSTLERIAREVVEIQQGFFVHGISHLKPLKMVEVADRVGVHVSTISRAISGKYLQSTRGIYDLKFFFTGGAQKSDGTFEARGSVIQRIKDFVEKENKQKPLSDIEIVRKLEGHGIKISRRTVTKYREAEGIPSSRQRRAF